MKIFLFTVRIVLFVVISLNTFASTCHVTSDVGAEQALRDCLATSDKIVIDDSLAGKTIKLTAELSITKSVEITGPHNGDVPLVTLDGQGASRIFNINLPGNQDQVHLNYLIMTNGKVPGKQKGGAIFAHETAGISKVFITYCYITNSNSAGGGAIFNRGNLTIEYSHINNNKTSVVYDPYWPHYPGGEGGGIYNDIKGSMTITSSQINNNVIGKANIGDRGGHGGAIYNEGYMEIYDITIKGNVAGPGGHTWAVSSLDGEYGGSGGGVYVGSKGRLYLENSNIIHNSAGMGGDVQNWTYESKMHVWSGAKSGKGGNGGGIAAECDSYVFLINTDIEYNRAGIGGPPVKEDGSGIGGNGGDGGNGGGIYRCKGSYFVMQGSTTVKNNEVGQAGDVKAKSGQGPDEYTW